MQTEMTALYGLTGMFFTTNRSHRPPRVTEETILKSFYESDEEEEEYEDEYEDDDGEEPTSAQVAARAAAAAARTTALAKAKTAREARIKKEEISFQSSARGRTKRGARPYKR